MTRGKAVVLQNGVGDRWWRCGSMPLALLLPLAGACRDPRTRDTHPVGRWDSGGVEIIENRKAERTSGLRIDAEPVTIVGGADLSLTQTVSAFLLADGRLVVADAGEVAIYIVAPDGRVLRRMGRRGRGPGEFGTLTAVWPYRGDSIVAYEGGMRRQLSVLSLQGTEGRSWRATGVDSAHYFLVPLGIADSGRFMVRTMNVITPAQEERVESPLTELLLFSANWDAVVTLGSFPDSERFRGRGRKVGALLFSEPARFAWCDGHIHVASSNHAQFDRVGGDGHVRRRVRWAALPAPVAEEDVRHERERRITDTRARLRGAPDAIMREAVDGGLIPLLDALPVPEVFPVVGALRCDDRGTTWALGYQRPGVDAPSPNIAQVFDSNGRWIARVTLPEGLRVLDVTRDRVVGLMRDQQGAEVVKVFRVRGAD